MSLIAAIGHISRDVVAGAPPRPGGGVFYAAQALSRVGADATIHASCSARDRGELLAALEAFGLPVCWYESSATTAYRFRYTRSGHRIMRQDAVGDPWTPERAVGAAGEAGWVNVAALVRTDFGSRTLSALTEGRMLLVDGQGIVRRPDLGPLKRDARIGDVLRHIDMLKLNEDEAALLVGDRDPERLLDLGVPEVILTLGDRGAIVVAGGRFEAEPGERASRSVDPTGAGDTLGAIYLATRARGGEPVDALRAGVRAASDLLATR